MSSITFLGDVWLPLRFSSVVELDGPFVFNLESPITNRTEPAFPKICLRAGNHIESTFGRKPIAVCAANNHILDYGVEGFRDTVESLRQSGIPLFGAGTLAENCNNPLLLQVDGIQIALLAYVCRSTYAIFAEESRPGPMAISLPKMQADIQEARRAGAEVIVLNLHWGDETVTVPKPEDVRLARALVDSGADLIIGHHSHCIQSFERYKGKSIFYGLGNCIFPNESALQPGKSGFESVRICFPKKYGNSLAVRFNLQNREAVPYMVAFNGKKLDKKNISVSRYRLPQLTAAAYEAHYKRRLHLDVAVFRLAALLLRRRIPKFSSFIYGFRAVARGIGVR